MASSHMAANDCLVQLERLLESLSGDNSPTTIQDNLALLNRVGVRDSFVPLIERIISNPGLLAEVASRSYRHVNHFDKLVLVGSDKLHGYRLTLHLWSPPYGDKELKKESIHDHRFNFWSVILTGILMSENFVESPDGEVMRQYRYVPEKRTLDVKNFYQFIGETRLSRSETLRKYAGESYYQSSPSIHRVLLPDSMTCTLVLRGPRQRNFTNTFRTDQPKVNTQVETSMYSASVVEEKLKALLNAIERA